MVKNPPAMQETLVRSLGWEDSLEKGKASHSSILAWRIPWTVQSWGHKELQRDTTTLGNHENVSKWGGGKKKDSNFANSHKAKIERRKFLDEVCVWQTYSIILSCSLKRDSKLRTTFKTI